jgi:hypothetical protein
MLTVANVNIPTKPNTAEMIICFMIKSLNYKLSIHPVG